MHWTLLLAAIEALAAVPATAAGSPGAAIALTVCGALTALAWWADRQG